MAKRKTKTQTELAPITLGTPSVIEPIVKSAGESHIMETLFNEGDSPTLKSIGFMQVKPGNNWVS